jgi:hypothetical protein
MTRAHTHRYTMELTTSNSCRMGNTRPASNDVIAFMVASKRLNAGQGPNPAKDVSAFAAKHHMVSEK